MAVQPYPVVRPMTAAERAEHLSSSGEDAPLSMRHANFLVNKGGKQFIRVSNPQQAAALDLPVINDPQYGPIVDYSLYQQLVDRGRENDMSPEMAVLSAGGMLVGGVVAGGAGLGGVAGAGGETAAAGGGVSIGDAFGNAYGGGTGFDPLKPLTDISGMPGEYLNPTLNGTGGVYQPGYNYFDPASYGGSGGAGSVINIRDQTPPTQRGGGSGGGELSTKDKYSLGVQGAGLVMGALQGGGGDDLAAEQRALAAGEAATAEEEEAARQARVTRGRGAVNTAFDQYTPQYFSDIAQKYMDYYLPQVDEQFNNAQRSLTLNSPSGSASSAYARQAGELALAGERERTTMRDRALSDSTRRRSELEGQRTQMLQDIDLAGDINPETVSQRALVTAAASAQPEPYSPLGELFARYTANQANASAAQAQGFRPQYPLLFSGGGGGSGGRSGADRYVG